MSKKLIIAVNNEFNHTPEYTVCSTTGLRVCELFRKFYVREDGMILSKTHGNSSNIWSVGSHTSRYLMTGIPNGNTMISVHVLVAVAFIDYNYANAPKTTVIDHIDGNIFNNALSNLQIISQSENLLRARRAKGKGTTIHRLSMDGELLESYDTDLHKTLKEQGYDYSQVIKVIKGMASHHKKFKWERK